MRLLILGYARLSSLGKKLLNAVSFARSRKELLRFLPFTFVRLSNHEFQTS